MPFKNKRISKLIIESPLGQLIVIDSTTVNPQITFYSPDRTNTSFINAPNFGVPNHVGLGMNGGVWTPGDGIARRNRVWLDDNSGFGRFETVRASDGTRVGGFSLIDEATGYFGYHDDTVDNWLRFTAVNALLNNPTGNVEIDAINAVKLILNNGGFDLQGPGFTFTAAGGSFNVPNDTTMFNNGRVVPRGIMGAPAATAAAGTATAVVGTEVRDAVLGNFVFTASAGRRYAVWLTGRKFSGAAGSLCSFNIRDGGAVTPTAASPLFAANATSAATLDAAGGPGQITCDISGPTFFATVSGVHTLSVFTVCGVGGPAITPVGACELYVTDVGA